LRGGKKKGGENLLGEEVVLELGLVLLDPGDGVGEIALVEDVDLPLDPLEQVGH
jgi:hypothetical protein